MIHEASIAVDEPDQQCIYIVDDDDAVRDALGMLCESAELSYSTYASGNEFLSQYSHGMSGCIVLDIRMPGMSGLELQQQLTERHSRLPIIFITGHGDLPMAVLAMRRGAADFMRKPIQENELLHRIHTVIREQTKLQAQHMGEQHLQALLQSLTEREYEIYLAVTDGVSNKVLASDLGISQRTVEVHRSRVMEKLEAENLAQLVRIRIQTE